MGPIIIITGTPGVGKTTVSKLLAIHLEAKHVDLSELAVREQLLLGWDEERKTSIADIERLRARLYEIASASEQPLILDSHYASSIVPYGEASSVFVLRKDPSRLKEELESRGYDVKKVRENVAAEILDVCLSEAVETYGEDKISEVDVTDMKPEEVAELLLKIIHSCKPTGLSHIDWLSKPEAEKLLEDLPW